MKTFLMLSFLVASSSIARAAEVVFHPEGSEFSVRFPERPFISTSQDTDSEGNPLTLVKAEFAVSKPAYFLRAEVAGIQAGSADSMTDEDIISRARTYAKSNGFLDPEIFVSKSALGRCATLRGQKTVLRANNTYENLMCYGRSSMIVLYTGSASQDFPPPAARAFFESLRRQ